MARSPRGVAGGRRRHARSGFRRTSLCLRGAAPRCEPGRWRVWSRTCAGAGLLEGDVWPERLVTVVDALPRGSGGKVAKQAAARRSSAGDSHESGEVGSRSTGAASLWGLRRPCRAPPCGPGSSGLPWDWCEPTKPSKKNAFGSLGRAAARGRSSARDGSRPGPIGRRAMRIESGGSEGARRYAVGIVNYQSYDDLDECLDSREVPVGPAAEQPSSWWTQTPTPSSLDELRERHPGGPRSSPGRIGATRRARTTLLAPGGRAVAPEAELRPDHEPRRGASISARSSRCLLAEIAQHKDVGRPGDGQAAASRTVSPSTARESCCRPNRRPRDRGSEEIDRGQYDGVELRLRRLGSGSS